MSEIIVSNETTPDDNDWVLDSLIGFLKGPLWNVSILTFIDQKSVVFDPQDLSDQSEHEYRLLYEEYKNLVDRLMSGHMSDLGISEQQFDEACRRADGLLANKFRQVLFEQIWAANEYQIFVRFMTQRNIELQLQALEILAQRYGLVYDSFIPHGSDRDHYLNDETIFNEAIKRSLAEGEDDNRAGIGSASDSKKDFGNEKIHVLQERARLEAEHEREHQKLSLAIKSALVIDNNQTEERITESSNAVTFDKELTSLKPLLTEGKALSNKDSNVKREKELTNTAKKVQKNESESKHSESEGNSFNAEEIRKRTEYLRKQRDKLLEIKKQEREKQMVKMEEQELLAKRPKSAKAMRSVVEDKKDEHLDDSDHSLAFRRSLAARLKAEVVEKRNQ